MGSAWVVVGITCNVLALVHDPCRTQKVVVDAQRSKR